MNLFHDILRVLSFEIVLLGFSFAADAMKGDEGNTGVEHKPAAVVGASSVTDVSSTPSSASTASYSLAIRQSLNRHTRGRWKDLLLAETPDVVHVKWAIKLLSDENLQAIRRVDAHYKAWNPSRRPTKQMKKFPHSLNSLFILAHWEELSTNKSFPNYEDLLKAMNARKRSFAEIETLLTTLLPRLRKLNPDTSTSHNDTFLMCTLLTTTRPLVGHEDDFVATISTLSRVEGITGYCSLYPAHIDAALRSSLSTTEMRELPDKLRPIITLMHINMDKAPKKPKKKSKNYVDTSKDSSVERPPVRLQEFLGCEQSWPEILQAALLTRCNLDEFNKSFDTKIAPLLIPFSNFDFKYIIVAIFQSNRPLDELGKPFMDAIAPVLRAPIPINLSLLVQVILKSPHSTLEISHILKGLESQFTEDKCFNWNLIRHALGLK